MNSKCFLLQKVQSLFSWCKYIIFVHPSCSEWIPTILWMKRQHSYQWFPHFFRCAQIMVNLIPYNPTAFGGFQAPKHERVERCLGCRGFSWSLGVTKTGKVATFTGRIVVIWYIYICVYIYICASGSGRLGFALIISKLPCYFGSSSLI